MNNSATGNTLLLPSLKSELAGVWHVFGNLVPGVNTPVDFTPLKSQIRLRNILKCQSKRLCGLCFKNTTRIDFQTLRLRSPLGRLPVLAPMLTRDTHRSGSKE
jgi:hypothetical protein